VRPTEPPPAFLSPVEGFDLSKQNARLLLAAVAALYGTNYAAVKLLDDWVGMSSSAALLRFALATLITGPAMLLTARAEPRVLSASTARGGLLVGGLFALGYVVQAIALETSEASVQAFLLSLTVVVCPVLQTTLDGVVQPRRVWTASAVAVAGVALLEASHILGSDSAGVTQGDVLGLLQPILFGAGFHFVEHCMADSQQPAEGDECALPAPTLAMQQSDGCAPLAASTAALAITAYSMLATLVVAAGWGLYDAGGDANTFAAHIGDALGTVSARPEVTLALVWCGVLTTAVCAYLEANVLSKISASDAMVVFATEPLWAAAFAWSVLGEVLGPSAYLGGSMIVLACILSSGALGSLLEQTSAESRNVDTDDDDDTRLAGSIVPVHVPVVPVVPTTVDETGALS